MLDELHRIEGGLQGPGDVIDETLLVAADDQRPLGQLQFVCHRTWAAHLMDPHLRGRDARPPLLAYFLAVGAAFAAACLRIPGQRGDERDDRLHHEGALARAGLDQATGGEQLDGVADGVA